MPNRTHPVGQDQVQTKDPKGLKGSQHPHLPPGGIKDPNSRLDKDPNSSLLNDKIWEKVPFAVVGADKEYQVNGKKVMGHKIKCGIIELENLVYCEFLLL